MNGTVRCFDLFPYAERVNRLLWDRLRRHPGWYPALTLIFPMCVTRTVQIGGNQRAAAYCRVLGRDRPGAGPEDCLGGYQAVLLRDHTGWPLFRFERIFVPEGAEEERQSVLKTLVDDGMRIAWGLGAVEIQSVHLETDDAVIPGFPVDWSAFGPLPDEGWLQSSLKGLGFSPVRRSGYYRIAAGSVQGSLPADVPAGISLRPMRLIMEDMVGYYRLWSEYCARHLPDLGYLVSKQVPLDPFLHSHLTGEEDLHRLLFLEQKNRTVGLVSWYPDVYPQLLTDETSGPWIRLRLASPDPGAVTSVKVLKCLGEGKEDSSDQLRASALGAAARDAAAAHPGLQWFQVGPVPDSDTALIRILEEAGFSRFGEIRLLSCRRPPH